jgi:hypothetical protein
MLQNLAFRDFLRSQEISDYTDYKYDYTDYKYIEESKEICGIVFSNLCNHHESFDVSQGKSWCHVLHLFLRRKSYEMPGSGLEILEARGCL